MQKLRRSIRPALQAALSIILCSVLFAGAAHGGSLAITTEPGGDCVQVNIAEGTTKRVYLTYTWGFTFAGPIGYAQIRVHGLPSGWSARVQKGSAVEYILGDLFGNGALVMMSRTQLTSPVVLAVLDITAARGVGTIWVVPRGMMDPPSPVDTLVPIQSADGNSQMVFSWPMYLNLTEGCETAVESRTWSHVKALYSR